MRNARRTVLPLCVLAFLVLFSAVTPAMAQYGTQYVSLQVRDIGKILEIADQIAASKDAAQQAPLPSQMVNQMIGGTDWLDPNRAISVVVGLSSDQMEVYGLVPFATPNQQFADMFGAISARDYYLLSYPPGQSVPQAAITELVRASTAQGPDMISLELPLAYLIERNQDQIRQGMAMMDQMPQDPSQPQPIGPQQMKEMGQAFLDMASQVQTLTVGLNLDGGQFRFRMNARALPGTELAGKLSAVSPAESLLSGYDPKGPIVVHTRAYDMASLMGFFGSLYESMGLDISCFESLYSMFTGESATVMAMDAKEFTIRVKGIAVLTQETQDTTALVSQWTSCMGNYIKSLNKFSETNPAVTEILPLPESMVSGRKVAGLKVTMSFPDTIGGDAPEKLEYTIRTAAMGRYMVFAPDDEGVAQLLETASALSPGLAQGPVVQARFDLAEFVRMVAVQVGEPVPASLPTSAAMDFIMNMGRGEGEMAFSININDFKALAEALESMESEMGPGMMGGDEDLGYFEEDETYGFEEEMPPSAPKAALSPEEMKRLEVRKNIEKGDLSRAYGSPKGAISHYVKALEVDPESAEAHFAMSVVLAETGQYEEALLHSNMAVAQYPENGNYLYGRAYIFLLKGDTEVALFGMQEAARYGSPDARRYLDRIMRQQK